MAFVVADSVKETTTTTGTGTYQLAGAPSSDYQTFVAGIGNGNLCAYSARNSSGWETGIGTVAAGTPNTLARTVVTSSSNGGAPVNWASPPTVHCGPIARHDIAGLNLHEQATPSAPATGILRLFAATRFGRMVLRYIDPQGIEYQLAQDTVLVMRNETGSTIPKFTAVRELTGIGSGGEPLMGLAQANADATMPAAGITLEAVPNNTTSVVIFGGVLQNVNTSGFSAADIVYVSESVAGGFTATEPAHPNLQQRLGRILTSHVSLGTVLVTMREERGNQQGTNRGWKVSQDFHLQGTLTPATITADQNNYAPTGHATVVTFRVATDAQRFMTGLAGGVDGRVVVLTNVGTNTLTLLGENAGSTAANRFAINTELDLRPNNSCVLMYDGTSSRWRLVTPHQNPKTQKVKTRVTNATTTGAKVTDLDVANLIPGTYAIKYWLKIQSSTIGTGLKFGVNFTGTAALPVMEMRFTGTGSAASTGVADDVGATLTGQIVEGSVAKTYATTAPNLGPFTGVATANSDILITIDALITVTAAGNLELWHGSETAASTSVEVGSAVVVTKVD